MRPRIRGSAGCALLALFACFEGDAPGDASSSENGQDTAVIEIAAAGRDPRRIEIRPPPSSVRILVRSRIVLMVDEGKKPRDVAHPDVEVSLTLEEGPGDGWTAEIAGVKILEDGPDPEAIDHLRKELERRDPVGLRGTLRSSRRAAGAVFDLDIPAGAGRLVRELLDHVQRAVTLSWMPIPEAPIGEGGVFRIERDLDLAGARWRESRTCRVESVAGPDGRIAFFATLRAPPQSYDVLTEDSPERSDLVEGSGRLDGVFEGDPGRGLPDRGEIRCAFDLRLRAFSQGEAHTVSARIELRYEVSSGDPG